MPGPPSSISRSQSQARYWQTLPRQLLAAVPPLRHPTDHGTGGEPGALTPFGANTTLWLKSRALIPQLILFPFIHHLPERRARRHPAQLLPSAEMPPHRYSALITSCAKPCHSRPPPGTPGTPGPSVWEAGIKAAAHPGEQAAPCAGRRGCGVEWRPCRAPR